MRKIVAAVFVSLDGVMQAPGGKGEDPSGGFDLEGWTVPLFDEAAGAAIGATIAEPFDLLLGRRTYDIFAGHWPRIGTGPSAENYSEMDAPIADKFNRTTKYVATHTPSTLGWQNSKALGNDVVGALRELKKQDGPMLLIQGSSDLIQTLLAADLIDEFRLMIFPVLLGKGKRLFGTGAMPGTFRLISSTTSPNGILIAYYERAGAVEVGSFGLEK
ncbi:dihydrofolate reductase family protein [Lacibacterium aquatile]|uniref:Dihydrofolate reductase family protein n=1 Tax=Lacibacterium aquatile TaxID=1168082 RepID=A0ABW5DM07_9PROT